MNRPNHITLVTYEPLPSTDAVTITRCAWVTWLAPDLQMCARGDGPTSAMECMETSHH